MPSSMWRPGRPRLPNEWPLSRHGGPGSHSVSKHPGPVDPTTEVGGYRDVGRRRSRCGHRYSTSRARAASVSPNACWVLRGSSDPDVGHRDRRRLHRRDRRARGVVSELVASGGSPGRASGEPGSNPAHTSSGSDVKVAPGCLAWSAPRWAEWLRLSPANGRRQPLIVYAKITVGRVRSAVRRRQPQPLHSRREPGFEPEAIKASRRRRELGYDTPRPPSSLEVAGDGEDRLPDRCCHRAPSRRSGTRSPPSPAMSRSVAAS